VGCAKDDEVVSGGAPSGSPTGTERSDTVPPTATTTPAPTTTAAPPAAPGRDLAPGDEGPDVVALQRRLTALRFWAGEDDGRYGSLVRQAVYAFEKANGLAVDGVLSGGDHPALAAAGPVRPQSGPAAGRLIEVDKTRQLVLLVEGGRVVWAFNAASGTEQPYLHPVDGPEVADTPVGHHQVLFGKDELEDGKMGPMYRPRYFHPDAIALHGDDVVPPAPVSHGCVRISRPAMDMVWNDDLAPVGSEVWVYGESPPPWRGAA
jgi:peptidoglycan hydrolase-like protein with peptidoglycan-binding domain